MDKLMMTPCAAGSSFGPGSVYVMAYTSSRANYYKIGCTSRNPNVRMREVQRGEKNPIWLVDSVQAKEMNGAETAAHNALKAKGLVKDSNRGGATDWFTGLLTPQQVFDVVKAAVIEHNASQKKHPHRFEHQM